MEDPYAWLRKVLGDLDVTRTLREAAAAADVSKSYRELAAGLDTTEPIRDALAAADVTKSYRELVAELDTTKPIRDALAAAVKRGLSGYDFPDAASPRLARTASLTERVPRQLDVRPTAVRHGILAHVHNRQTQDNSDR